MTDPTPPIEPPEPLAYDVVLDLEPEQLDGHSIDELADYLDAGMTPPDPSIDDSPACQNALEALARLRILANGALEASALQETDRDDGWVTAILANIGLEARAGRDIPLRSTAPSETATLTEGSVRALIRRAGDTVDGLLIGRCALDGDVEEEGEPVRVRVTASILYGQSIPTAADRARAAIEHELLKHTELNLTGIDVVVRDVHLATTPGPITTSDPIETPHPTETPGLNA